MPGTKYCTVVLAPKRGAAAPSLSPNEDGGPGSPLSLRVVAVWRSYSSQWHFPAWVQVPHQTSSATSPSG